VILGLIALFSSYDHITAFGRSIGLQQQWGIPLIAASVATVLIDSQLATRVRDRARDRADQAALEAKRERSRAAVGEVGRRPWRENARERALSALIKQHCFPPECNSIPPQQTEIDCGPSSP
jgi:hypothetical protein